MFSGDKLLCVAELEVCLQNFAVGQLLEPSQKRPDLRRDGIMPFTVAGIAWLAFLGFRYLPWARTAVDFDVGGQCPSGFEADAPYSSKLRLAQPRYSRQDKSSPMPIPARFMAALSTTRPLSVKMHGSLTPFGAEH